ncbi:MAG: saccharopine dehydrogenase C-terminal domain-containing protein [Cyclobacteriaceae bacterium]
MKRILVLGAGRSSSALISYLLNKAESAGWQVTVGDFNIESARVMIGLSKFGTATRFDINESELCRTAIEATDVVVSLLPANFHPLVAKYCLSFNKHLFTASYISNEMQTFDEEARSKGLLFMNECGLDPGIDHMSAKAIIDTLKGKGATITSFESFAGGLIAPETDPQNPWRYKFTWNPRNVVMAGQGTAKFIEEGQYKFIPYQQLFKRTTYVHIPGYGDFQGYANRDSLKYIGNYGLEGITTMVRGTLHNDGFCAAWNILVQLGCTEDSYNMEGVEKMTHRDFINSFLPYDHDEMLENKLVSRFNLNLNGGEIEKLRWSGFFDKEEIGLESGTPARILEHILNKKWRLGDDEKDMVIMWHRFRYKLGNKKHEIESHLVLKGEDSIHTAMAKGVGLPMAIGVKLLLEDKIKRRGVCIPIDQEVYEPILKELSQLGINAEETDKVVD